MSGTGSRTVNTAAGAGTAMRPDWPARCRYRRACRAEQPHRWANWRAADAVGTPGSSRSATALPRGERLATGARTTGRPGTGHVGNVLLDMSHLQPEPM